MQNTIVTTSTGMRIQTEALGDPNDPPVLLISGGTASGIVWPDEFCRGIAEAGYYVVRYDHRDTGMSSTVDYQQDPYGLADLAADAAEVALLLGIAPAHVVGISLGGMIGQLLALDHPAVVGSLVCISSSPDANADPHLAPSSGLPRPEPVWVDLVDTMRNDPATDPEALVDQLVDSWRVTVLGDGVPFDEAYWRDLVHRILARTTDLATAQNHAPVLNRAEDRTPRLAGITVPTLVLHGTHDVVLPPAHGRALAAAVPEARLIEITGMGHMFVPEWADRVLDPLLEHLDGAPHSPPR